MRAFWARGVMLVAFISWTSLQVESEAQALLEAMTPEERVGQLFLVSFEGSEVGEESPIFDLLVNHHIAGVVLSRANDNFREPDTALGLQNLVLQLHSIEYERSLEPEVASELTSEPDDAVYVPPFVALRQEGNGHPYSELLTETTQFPSNMAVGATWEPELAGEVGRLLGQELASVGVNLLLGPSLDILEDPLRSDLGVRSYGGDPFWVSLMGEAFITGFHQGSQNRIGVIAKHFPGLGGSDRPIEVEVATVRKSLSQLLQFELVPFLKVTGAAPGTSADVADGFLTSHIRYQGFQGNIRATTRPVSLDPEAYGQLLDIEEIRRWREGGGLLISDSLGSQAMHRFYESLGSSFKGHLVARDAFLAGNDLLILSDFQSEGDPDQITSVRATLEFFAQKYREDPVFAERVDESVLRVLEFKLRLFGGEFDFDRVLSTATEPGETTGPINLEVARAAASLISPSLEEIRDRVGGPPELGERIVFITDVRPERQCSTCELKQSIARTALEDTVLRLYGTQAAGQVGAWNLSSYSMADLAVMLGESPPGVPPFPIVLPEEMNEAIATADWLVFIVLDDDASVFGSDALKMLLDTRPDLARDRRVVVFAHDLPNYLDATEISKVDLYYALYSKTSPFVEVAARLLFQELPATGAPPVSVPGIGYDLIKAMSPDPAQVIRLTIAQEGEGEEYSFGDLVQLQTGTILDVNGNRVPDGTPVEFLLSYQPENIQASLQAVTQGGVAAVPLTLDRVGQLSIQARSEPANTSEILQLNVQEGEPAVVVVNTPQIASTATQAPTETTAAASATPEPTEVAVEDRPPETISVTLTDLLWGVLGIALTASIGQAVASRNGEVDELDRVRLIAMAAIGGLLAYNYLALSLPGSEQLLELMGASAGFVVGAVGGALGLLMRELLLRSGRLS